MTFSKAFLDANVLYARTTRDWLLQLAGCDLGFLSIVSSLGAIDEAVSNITLKNPAIQPETLEQIRPLMHANLHEVVPEGAMTGKSPNGDPNDLHIHAAVVAAGCDYLVTADEGFLSLARGEAADELPYEIYHPDDFLILINQSHQGLVREVLVSQLAYWAARSNSKSITEALIDAKCPEFARVVAQHLIELSGV